MDACHSYRIFVTGESTGLMETIVDAVSLHSLKKAAYSRLTREGGALPSYSMYDYYLEVRATQTRGTRAADNESRRLATRLHPRSAKRRTTF